MEPGDAIKEWLDAAKQMLIDDLDNNDRNATGRTKASLKVANVTDTSGQLLGADHILHTFGGRGPGKMPPISQIIDWCIARRIPRSKAWIIAKNISVAGTKLFRQRAYLDNALTRAVASDRIAELAYTLKGMYTVKLESEIKDLFK